jgi:two-component system LytT family sensor kinase
VNKSQWRIWAISFGAWGFVSLAATATIYQFYRPTPNAMSLRSVAGMQFCQIFTYAPLTPFAYLLAIRFPIQRNNWRERCVLHLLFGVWFTLGHILIKGATPYGYWDSSAHDWASAFWDARAHAFRASWPVFRSMFLTSIVDDITDAYLVILLVAQAVSYYQRSRDGELRAAQLETQLANARLQTLKSQIQPHFLFNTLHSISALMLFDVQAAERMMSRLSDLLRISLENAGTQITTLKRELEFVNCYLEIEKIRFEERLKVVYEIAPETLDAEIPHLLLQPLVDNAVKHGIAKLAQGGEIKIASTKRDSQLHIEIRNNGAKPTGERHLAPKGIGLRVTRERLESIYGRDHTFELRNAADFVVAQVCVPFAVHLSEEVVEGGFSSRLTQFPHHFDVTG